MKTRPVRPRARVARRLRRDATDVEQRLWRALQELGRSLTPQKRFRRQHPVGRHVVDFACPVRKLAIEVDGGQHADRAGADTARAAELGRHGYRVIRFWNNEVVENLDGVLDTVRRELEGS